MSGRVVPYHCPYCGEEDLRPYEPETDSDVGSSRGGAPAAADLRGGWHCRDCTRVFTLKYHGMAAPQALAAPTTRPPASSDGAGASRGGIHPSNPESE